MADLFDEMFKSAVYPFTPHLTPLEMLQRGVFGYSYFTKATEEDFEGLAPAVAALARRNREPKYKAKLNAFGVKSGNSYEEWMANGWIYPEDPLGWFHWYCRFHNGRRHPRDMKQIARWNSYGERWGIFGRNQIKVRGFCSDVVKQGLLHWAYEPEKVLTK